MRFIKPVIRVVMFIHAIDASNFITCYPVNRVGDLAFSHVDKFILLVRVQAMGPCRGSCVPVQFLSAGALIAEALLQFSEGIKGGIPLGSW